MGWYHDELSRITRLSRRTFRLISWSHQRSCRRRRKKNRKSLQWIRLKNHRTQLWSLKNLRINRLCQRRHCPHHRILKQRFIRLKIKLRIRHRQLKQRNRQHLITHLRRNRIERKKPRKLLSFFSWTRRCLRCRLRSLRSLILIIRRSFLNLNQKSLKHCF